MTSLLLGWKPSSLGVCWGFCNVCCYNPCVLSLVYCRILCLVNLGYSFSHLGPVLIAPSCWCGPCLAPHSPKSCWISVIASIWPWPRMSTLLQRLWLSCSPDYGLCVLIPGALFPRNRVWSCLWLTMPVHCLTHTGCGHLLVKGLSALWTLPESWIRNASPSLSLLPPSLAVPWSQEVGHTPDHLSPLLLCYFLAALHGMWDLSSSTRDQIGSRCIGIAES